MAAGHDCPQSAPPGRRTGRPLWITAGRRSGEAMATNPALTQQADRKRVDPVVTGLVTRARNGEQQAWDALVDRYAPLIWAICRRHRLEDADAADAAQNIWLKLNRRAGRPSRPGRASRLAGRHHPARMRPYPAHRPPTLRRRGRARHRNHPRRSHLGSRAGPAHGRTGRGPAGGHSGSFPRAASNCSPCSPTILPCRMQKSEPGGTSRSAASGPAAAAAWTSCAATRLSPRWSTPAPRPPRHRHGRSERKG